MKNPAANWRLLPFAAGGLRCLRDVAASLCHAGGWVFRAGCETAAKAARRQTLVADRGSATYHGGDNNSGRCSGWR